MKSYTVILTYPVGTEEPLQHTVLVHLQAESVSQADLEAPAMAASQVEGGWAPGDFYVDYIFEGHLQDLKEVD